MFKFKQVALVAAVAAAAGSASANPISSAAEIGNAKVITFDAFDGLVIPNASNPVLQVGTEVGEDVVLSSVPYTIVGQRMGTDLGDNGAWTDYIEGFGGSPYVSSAFITNRGEFGFSFANPVSAVGAILNQYQAPGQTNNSLLLIAYDQYGNDLESYRVSIDTPYDSYNAGSFYGFKRASADIYGFGIADGSFVMDSLTFSAPVPEPSTYALLIGGLMLVGQMVRRRVR